MVPYPLDRSLSNRIRPPLAPMSCRSIPASIDARKIAAPGAKKPIATSAAKGKNPESPQPSPNRTPPATALPVDKLTSGSPCPPQKRAGKPAGQGKDKCGGRQGRKQAKAKGQVPRPVRVE